MLARALAGPRKVVPLLGEEVPGSHMPVPSQQHRSHRTIIASPHASALRNQISLSPRDDPVRPTHPARALHVIGSVLGITGTGFGSAARQTG